MDQSPQLIFTRPPKSKAIPIVNPNSSESLPTPIAQIQPAKTFPVSLHPTTKDSGAKRPLNTPANWKDSLSFGIEEDSPDKGIGQAFNIYARPFVPESLAIINELDGHEINTPGMKRVDFGAYTSRYIGWDFLPPIPHPIEPLMTASLA